MPLRNLALSAAVLSASAVAVLAAAAVPALAQAPRDGAPRAEPAIERQVERRVVIRRGAGEGMTQHLRAVLQLRPAQEAALQAYVAAARPDEPQVERFDTRGEERRTTPERLAQLEDRMARQQARTRTLVEATRKFYDQLDASQKRAFDEMPMLMVGVNVGPMLLPIADMPDMSELRELRELRRLGEPPRAPEPPRPPRPPQPAL